MNYNKGESGILAQKSILLSVEIVKYYNWLVNEKKEFVMSKQLLRSGTSIGANIHEANFGASKSDFINKLQISLKETAESEYWMTVLRLSGYTGSNADMIDNLMLEIKRLLISSIKTVKNQFDDKY